MNNRLHSIFFIFIMLTMNVSAQSPATQLTLPRFATLRATKANLHVGPGPNYPISWLLLRPGMPLEIIAEFDTWRQVRDWQGTEGWIHKSLLKGKRSFWTLGKTHELKDKPDEKAKTIAFVEAAVIGVLHECQAKWCRVEMKSAAESNKNQAYKGWLPRQAIWGIYPHENKL
jgi:SH3-like domain-containing protein